MKTTTSWFAIIEGRPVTSLIGHESRKAALKAAREAHARGETVRVVCK